MFRVIFQYSLNLLLTRSYHPKTGYESLVQGAHKSTVWATRHLPQNRDVFVTCGGDGSVNLWK
jgi:hypothetical protein